MGERNDDSCSSAADLAALDESLPLMQERDFVDKGKAESVALAPVFWSEGVKSLKSPVTGEVGNPFPLVGN